MASAMHTPVSAGPARVGICRGSTRGIDQERPARTTFQIFVRRSGLRAVRSHLRASGIWIDPSGRAAAARITPEKSCSRLPLPLQVAELGSGTGKKTRWILEALSQRQKTYYYPIEISPSALAACEKEMGQIDLVSVVGYEQPYLEGLRAVADRRASKRSSAGSFLGQHDRKFRPRRADESFCATCARFCFRATRCCWAPTWKKTSEHRSWRTMIPQALLRRLT